MSQLQFFQKVDTLVTLEADEVRNMFKETYTAAVADSVSQTNQLPSTGVIVIHTISDTLPASDDANLILLNREDNGIYQFDNNGKPNLITYLRPGIVVVIVGRDFDNQQLLSLVNRFDNSIIETPFNNASTMVAKIAIQLGIDTYIFRTHGGTNDIICINNINSADYDVDRYILDCLLNKVVQNAIIYNNSIFIAALGNGGVGNNQQQLIKIEQNSLDSTIYDSNSLPSGLSSETKRISLMAVVNSKLYLFEQSGVSGTEKWFSFDLRKFTDISPAGLAAKIQNVIEFNNGYLFIGNDGENTVAYHLPVNGLLSDVFQIDIENVLGNFYITDGKNIFGIAIKENSYEVIDSEYNATIYNLEPGDEICYPPFLSKKMVHVIAKNGANNTVIYKSDFITGKLDKSYDLDTNLSTHNATDFPICTQIGTDENVALVLDSTINLLKRKSLISIK